MTPDEFADALDLALAALARLVDGDWSLPAASLEWDCRQTLDHTIDCVFSYALQIAARAPDRYLPFTELHALPEAEPVDLLTGLRAVGSIFLTIARAAPADAFASDGFLRLNRDDWCARAAYEVLLHTHDVACGMGGAFNAPPNLCALILESTTLWMFDRTAVDGADPWTDLLRGSGRPVA